MDNEHSLGYAIRCLFLMALSLAIPLIIIGASGWIISVVSIIVFVTALCGNEGIAYVYRLLHNIILRPGLYIWALISAINGPQDIIAIGFYVVFVFQLWNIIANFVGEIIILSSALSD